MAKQPIKIDDLEDASLTGSGLAALSAPSPALFADLVDETVEPLVPPEPAAVSNKKQERWERLAADMEPDIEKIDFSFIDRGPLFLADLDIPPHLFEPYWCRVVLPNGQTDHTSIVDARQRHYRPVPADMLPERVIAGGEEVDVGVGGGIVIKDHMLMIRPRKIAQMEQEAMHASARRMLDVCLQEFRTNVTVEGLMQSIDPKVSRKTFRGRVPIADND